VSFEQKMEKCNEIEDIGKRNECKIKILEEELIAVRRKLYPVEELTNAIKDYAEPKFNALGVRMGNVETIMANADTKTTNLDTKITNMDSRMTKLEETITKGFDDLKKGQIKIAKEPAESLYK